MRKMSTLKNAVLLILMVWLSLKVWTTISEIANGPRNIPYTKIENQDLAKDTIHNPKMFFKKSTKQPGELADSDVKLDKHDLEPTDVALLDEASHDQDKPFSVEVTSNTDDMSTETDTTKSPKATDTNTEKPFTIGIKRTTHEPPKDTTSIDTGTENVQPLTIKVQSSPKKITTPIQNFESQHVVFLKVHKCGSSSVQNIFLRFGYRRNLTFILGHDDMNKSESGYVNVISYKNSLSDDVIVPPPPGRHFDILCCHVIFNEEQFQKYLPEDTKYIGIVREPVKRLESAFNYFHLFQNIDPSEFASNPLKYDVKFPSMANNRMAFEYGFPKDCFPLTTSNSSFETRQNITATYIKALDKRFDFIIVNERMDESLVYMKRLLNWQLKDILYVRLLTAKKPHRRFNEQDTLKLRDYLYLDFAIYEYALEKFKEKIAHAGDDFMDEVNRYREINAKVGEFCNSNTDVVLYIDGSSWNEEFEITREDCRLFELFEMKFIQDVRLQQYGTINN